MAQHLLNIVCVSSGILAVSLQGNVVPLYLIRAQMKKNQISKTRNAISSEQCKRWLKVVSAALVAIHNGFLVWNDVQSVVFRQDKVLQQEHQK